METEMSKDEAVSAEVAALVVQARAAYQQNRIKECLTLSRTILQADPANAAALQIQSAVRSEMQRDISDARALIDESRNKPDAQKFRKAAEIILLKALYLDPESEDAKTLLASIRTSQDVPPAKPSAPSPAVAATAPAASVAAPPAAPAAIVHTVPAETPAPIVEPIAAPAPTPERMEFSAPPSGTFAKPATETTFGSAVKLGPPEAIPFTTAPTFETPLKKSGSGSRFTVPIVVVAIAVIVGGLLLARQWKGNTSTASATAAGSNSAKATENSYAKTETFPETSGGTSSSLNASANSGTTAANGNKLPANTPAGLPPLPGTPANDPSVTPAANNKSGVPAAPAMGSLAVSSAVPAEIYIGDKYLGSTPTTLQLAAGTQTIEYRHGDLRSVVTHIVKANETTPALVTFDVTVQLNARPWANVSIEGSTRLSLGQTPLSNVKLPVGSVLVFENPNFPSKSHKIVIDDKTIQMVFQ